MIKLVVEIRVLGYIIGISVDDLQGMIVHLERPYDLEARYVRTVQRLCAHGSSADAHSLYPGIIVYRCHRGVRRLELEVVRGR